MQLHVLSVVPLIVTLSVSQARLVHTSVSDQLLASTLRFGSMQHQLMLSPMMTAGHVQRLQQNKRSTAHCL